MTDKSLTVAAKPQNVLAAMAGRYQMPSDAFEATLRSTVLPQGTTREQLLAFLSVAKQYDLNPFTREIYGFPAKGGVQVIVSIDGWTKIINAHKKFNGIEFREHTDDAGQISAITATIWRKDREHPTVVTEYMAECKRSSEPWNKWPIRMLRHKALIQCARVAFGFSGIVEQDEAERMSDRSPMVDISPIRKADLGEKMQAVATRNHRDDYAEVMQDAPETAENGPEKPIDDFDAVLVEATRIADKEGTQALAIWWSDMPRKWQNALLPHKDDLKKIATETDAKRAPVTQDAI